MMELTPGVIARAYMATALKLDDRRNRLKPRERDLAKFILNHSLGRGRLSLRVPHRAWLKDKTQISEGNLSEVLSSLARLGILLTRRTPEFEELRLQLDASFWRVPVPPFAEVFALEKELQFAEGSTQLELLTLEQSLAEALSDVALISEAMGPAKMQSESENVITPLFPGALESGLRGSSAPAPNGWPANPEGEIPKLGTSQIGNFPNREDEVPKLGISWRKALQREAVAAVPKLGTSGGSVQASEALASAYEISFKAKAKACTGAEGIAIGDRLWEVIAREMTAQPKYERQWRAMLEENPIYVQHLLEKLAVARKEESVPKPAAWMSRIARDDGRWPR